MKRLLAGAVLVLALGCGGYYNGMYNTDRAANQARRAERDGRTFEANGLWGQVATRAESVLVRHPNSRYADRARLLQGTALARLNNCDQALQPLETVMVSSRDRDLSEQAAMLLGGCRLSLGDADGATSAYARLTSSSDPSRRSIALWAHSRALREAGNYQGALAESMESADPRAQGERAAALAALGRVAEATAVTDSLLARVDSLAPWDSIFAGFARTDPAAASALADRLAAAATLPAALRAGVLLQDGTRLVATDPSAADRRLAEAAVVGEGTLTRAAAILQASHARLARADSAADLAEEASRLEATTDASGSLGPRAFQLALQIRRVLLVTDSTPPAMPRGDLRLFLAGELARDSLAAPRFAARQFRRILSEWPDSPYAPKAMLSLILLEPASGDSLRQAAAEHYGSSPYLLLTRGEEGPTYEALEDSLRHFADTFRPEVRRPVPPPTRTPRQPARPASPGDAGDKP